MNIILSIFLFFTFNTVLAQDFIAQNQEKFFFDAVVFDDYGNDSAKVDLFFIVPYQTLNFKSNQNIFGANYELMISIYDTSSFKIKSETIQRTLVTEDYYTALGGNADYDKASLRIKLPKGEYQVKVSLIDGFNNESYSKMRNISILDFNNYDFSLSGMMLVSTIEEVNGKFRITPYLSDDIGGIRDGFFVFLEAYNYKNIYDSVFFNFDIFSDDKLIYSSEPTIKYIGESSNRIYLKIDLPKKLLPGGFRLRINSFNKNTIDFRSESGILAAAQRTIKYEQSMGAKILADLKNAVDQLIYIAYNEEIEVISKAETDDKKIELFEQFWERKDPSPGSPRNEAMIEYYSRIEFADKNFRSYTKGWRTDKGMVYIIFGPPMNISRNSNFNDGKIYEQWIYSNNREFLFVDNTGFGDYRLVRPITVTEKYQYGRN